jgi:hypothetical protein
MSMADSKLALVDRQPDGAQRTPSVRGNALLRLAQATIGLSRLAPRLTELAAARQAEARSQAESSKDVASLAQRMSASLDETVATLRSASAEIADLTGLIRRIADQTSLIAINAGVAAARAGDAGRTFGVLAQEIGMLSRNTADAARDVDARIRRLQDSAERTAHVVGHSTDRRKPARAAQGPGLAWVLEQMVEAEASAARQAEEAHEITALGTRLRGLSEEMIRSVGAFRLDAHRRAEALLDEVREDPRLASGDPAAIARALRAALERCPFVELAYATDARGRQVTANVARAPFNAAYGESGVGRDWSRRPWFTGALGTGGVFSSEIYRSAATDEFCLTVAATFGRVGGAALGVVALDVNFRQLLETRLE